MKRTSLFLFCLLVFTIFPSLSNGKELPKIAVWDLIPGDIKPVYAQDLTSILVSEISKLEKYEVYSQENVKTLAGWTAERMQLGCTDTKCLTALGQMDIAKLISGRVGKIGSRYAVSLNLFDTQNARGENSVSVFGRSEDELIDLVQAAVRKLLGLETPTQQVATSGTGKPDLRQIAKDPEFQELPIEEQRKAFAEYIPDFASLPQSEEDKRINELTGGKRDPVTGMEFVFVKGGCFEMGDTFGDGEASEKPVHKVCVDDFYLGKYEVTQAQWKRAMGINPSDPLELLGEDNYPVVIVSWNEV